MTTLKDYSNGYPHGFIHPGCTLSGSFSTFGFMRVQCIYFQFTEEVRKNIIISEVKSLFKRAEIDGVHPVFYNPVGSDKFKIHYLEELLEDYD